MPVLNGGKCVAFLVSGYFLKKIPTRRELDRQWESWSGQKPLPDDVDYKRFVYNFINMPLLDGPQAQAHLKLLKMAAGLISGDGNPEEITGQAARLNEKVFAKWKLNSGWPRKALGLEIRSSDISWPDKNFGPEDRLVTRMKRAPTVAMALLLVDEPGRGLDEVDAMIRQKRLERAGYFLAQNLEETAAFPVWNEGLVFLTSPRPGANPTQARLQLREKALSISERMGKQFGTSAWVGIGTQLHPGEGLNPSCQEAFQALQWAIYQNKKILFWDEKEPSDSSQLLERNPWPNARQLIDSCLRGSGAEKATQLDQYVRDVLRLTAERADLIRVHLLDALSLYAAMLEQRLLLPAGRLSGSLGEWVSLLDKQRATHELISSFKSALQAFAEFSVNPQTAELDATVKELKGYVLEHFQSNLTAGQAARQMGISRATFYRNIQKRMGMGFKEYVQKVRLEEAKRLLRTSRYSVARVAQECGFSSSAYFISAFKKSTLKTPSPHQPVYVRPG